MQKKVQSQVNHGIIVAFNSSGGKPIYASDDINQKILMVVTFIALLLLLCLYVKNGCSERIRSRNQWRVSYLASSYTAHSNILTLFDVSHKTMSILRGKHRAPALDITNLVSEEDKTAVINSTHGL